MSSNVISIVPSPTRHRKVLKQLAGKFYNRAAGYLADNDLKSAETYFKKALQHYQELEMAYPRMEVLRGLFDCYERRGNLQRCREVLGRLITLNEELGFDKDAADNEHLLASVLLEEKHIDEGIHTMQSAAERLLELGQEAQAAGLYVELGDLCRKELHRFEQARDYYRKAAKLHADTNHDNAQHGYCHNVLGIVYEKLDAPQEAHKHYATGADIYLKLHDHKGSGICVRNIGHLYSKRNQPVQALYYFRKALSRFHKAALPVFEAATQESLGNVHKTLGNLPAARKAWEEAARQFEKAGEKKTATRLRDKCAALELA